VKREVRGVIKEDKGEKDSLLNDFKIKSQAAMEYLMTYGWAILIIALALGALYSLGIMNPKNFLPRAPPGSCFVFRPNGPGTTNYVSLQGTCGYLPQYVAQFGGGYISLPATQMPNGGNPRTITAWIYPTNEVGNHGIVYYGGQNCNPNGAIFGLILAGNNLYLWGSCDDTSTSLTPQINSWSFVAVTYNGGSIASIYLNGIQQNVSWSSSVTCNSATCTSAFIGGAPGWWGGLFSGNIANVQIYNTALTPQEIQYLYQEGLGGAPIRLGSLIAWYPLNGDAKDYSGNNNHGTINGGVTFVQNYNPP
jgi:hypothetical protein